MTKEDIISLSAIIIGTLVGIALIIISRLFHST